MHLEQHLLHLCRSALASEPNCRPRASVELPLLQSRVADLASTFSCGRRGALFDLCIIRVLTFSDLFSDEERRVHIPRTASKQTRQNRNSLTIRVADVRQIDCQGQIFIKHAFRYSSQQFCPET